jgi:hypothetical protein
MCLRGGSRGILGWPSSLPLGSVAGGRSTAYSSRTLRPRVLGWSAARTLRTRFFVVLLLLGPATLIARSQHGSRKGCVVHLPPLTLGGRPRFRGIAGAVGSALAVAPFLFLLPLGRPLPRLTGTVDEPKGRSGREISHGFSAIVADGGRARPGR